MPRYRLFARVPEPPPEPQEPGGSWTSFGASTDAGTYGSRRAHFAAFEQQLRDSIGTTQQVMQNRHSFHPALPTSINDTEAQHDAALGVPLTVLNIKMEPWATAATGALNGNLRRLLDTITRPTVLICGHEPENDPQNGDYLAVTGIAGKGGGTPEAQRVWRETVAQFVATVIEHGNPMVQPGTALMNHTFLSNARYPAVAGGGLRDPEHWNYAPLLSEAERARVVWCVDTYEWHPSITPGDKAEIAFRWAAQAGFSKFGIAETAAEVSSNAAEPLLLADSIGDPDKHGSFREIAERRRDLLFVSYFQSGVNFADGTDQKLEHPETLRAYARTARRLTYDPTP